MHVVQVNYAYDSALGDPGALLERCTTLTGWSEAVGNAGASRVTVVQRFSRDARLSRNGVDYLFRSNTWRVQRAVAVSSPDVVHVNGLVFPVQTWRLRSALPHGTAVVTQDHASRAPVCHPTSPMAIVRRAVQARCLGAVDGFLFSTRAHAAEWERAGLLAPWHSVYEVMEASTAITRTSREVARMATGIDGAPALLWVGRLNANKDPLTVIDGFERALDRLPGATLTMICGDGDLLPAVRTRVARSPRLGARVHLRGRVPHHEMPVFYSAADLFVLGSHHEGSGYALLEACACGVLPVVTDIPSFRTITRNGTIGRLWSPGDAPGLASALATAAHGHMDRARARVLDHFERELSWRIVGRKAFEAYRDVLGRRAAAGARPH